MLPEVTKQQSGTNHYNQELSSTATSNPSLRFRKAERPLYVRQNNMKTFRQSKMYL